MFEFKDMFLIELEGLRNLCAINTQESIVYV